MNTRKTSKDYSRSVRSKRSKNTKSGTPILKFARTIDEFRTTFKDYGSKFSGISQKLIEFEDNFNNIRGYIENNTLKITNINEILAVIQDKVGYFETKGAQHFRKHYLGPLNDLDALKKDVIQRAEFAFKSIKDTKDDHLKRMIKIESELREQQHTIKLLKNKLSDVSKVPIEPQPETHKERGSLTDIIITQNFIK